MGLFNVAFDDFGGLDLSNAPDETAGALDLLNVDFDQPGRVRSRDGYTTYLTNANTITYADALPYGGDSSWVFIADSAHKVGAYKGGILQGSLSAAGTANYTTFAHVGTPTAEYVYALNGVDLEAKRWDGSTWTTITFYGIAALSALSPADNRLVVTGAASTHPSRVLFSDAGAPEAFSTNNYVDLEPGTSGAITAMVTWQNFIFVFKNDRFYVFYGTSTDNTGSPVFNYRPVYCGVGPTAPNWVTVAPDGVYFLDAQNGIYRTTGGVPQRIPGLERLFANQIAATFFSQANFRVIPISLSYANKRLFFTWRSGIPLAAPGTFVYGIDTGQWTYWVAGAGHGFSIVLEVGQPSVGTGTYGPIFIDATANTKAFIFGGSTDDTAAITAFYRSGFQSFDWRGRNLRSGIHNVEKIVRESMVDGTGTVSYTLSNQWVQAANLPAARTLTLGAAPQIQQARDRTAVKGREFSFQISGTAPWTVEKVVLALHGYEDAGLRETGN